jgi:DNA-binding FrmR family transcriptional regulator
MACNCNKNIKVNRSDDDKNKLLSRLNRITGQLDGIKKMINDDRYCADILIQLSAVDKAIKSLASVILDNHMHSCVLNGIKDGDYEKLDEIVDLFRRFS